MLQEGDIWLSKRTKPGGRPYEGLYIFRVRVWRKRAWRENGVYWGLTELIDENTNKGLQKVEHRPRFATYTGIYRYESEERHADAARTAETQFQDDQLV